MTRNGSTASPRPCSPSSPPARPPTPTASRLGGRDPWTGQTSFGDLPAILLKGLAAPQARQLLSAAIPNLDDQVGQRIVAETRGNPLALIEMGRELTPGQLTGSEP